MAQKPDFLVNSEQTKIVGDKGKLIVIINFI